MWIPKREEEITQAVSAGALEETTISEVKRELPTKNNEIAKDVAAMANDGGILIYGIDEDEHGFPRIPHPIPLEGQRERITSIVQTSIAEPPAVMIHAIPTTADPTKGYIVVVVPASERAPHMVVVKGEHRYYGRTATGNIPLTEGEVARLYERRNHWEVDRDALLAEEIAQVPFPARKEFAYLHIIARPVLCEESLLERAANSKQAIQGMLQGLVEIVGKPKVFPRPYEPGFHPGRWIRRAEGFLGILGGTGGTNDSPAPGETLQLQVDFDGSAHLFCGRAGERVGERLMLFFELIAGNTTRFLALLGQLYEKARYTAPVDLGLAVTGIRGSTPFTQDVRLQHLTPPYDRDDYRRTCRASALVLQEEPVGSARQLTMPLFDAMSQAKLDPFPHKG